MAKENNLTITHPKLCKEWDYEKNEKGPENYKKGSKEKVYWRLNYTDSKTGKNFILRWQSRIDHRCKGVGCPYLSGQAILENFNDLLTTHPSVAAEWDYEKNYPLTPQQVTAGSGKKVWWLLPYDDPKTGKHFDFSWESIISSRCNNNNNNGCPYLFGQKIWPTFNDLTTTDKEIAETWHPTLNKQLKPTQVSRGSGLSVWWLCEKGHTYKSKIYNRIIRGCPYCAASSSEKLIHNILNNNDISFEIEKRLFEEIKRNPYDIFLNNENLFIELDGKQHFEEIEFFERRFSFKKRIETDNKKNKYAFENNIPLLRIPYTYFDDELKMEALVMDFIRTRVIPKEIIDFYKQYEFSNYPELVEKYNEALKLKAS